MLPTFKGATWCWKPCITPSIHLIGWYTACFKICLLTYLPCFCVVVFFNHDCVLLFLHIMMVISLSCVTWSVFTIQCALSGLSQASWHSFTYCELYTYVLQNMALACTWTGVGTNKHWEQSDTGPVLTVHDSIYYRYQYRLLTAAVGAAWIFF